MTRYLFFLLVFTMTLPAWSQHRIGDFMAYGSNNGLPGSFYYSVLQSSDGYLWIGSSSGLIRFDGKRYETFFSDYADSNSLADNVINDIIEDDRQNLWIAGFYQGLTRYNLHTGQMKRYMQHSDDDKQGMGINQLFFDQGELWIATEHRGLAHYLPDIDAFEFFLPDKSEQISSQSLTMSGIARDNCEPEVLWISSYAGLYVFHTKEGTFTQYILPHPEAPSTPLPLLCIEIDQQNTIWVGTWYGGLSRFDISTKRFETLSYRNAVPPNTAHYVVLDIKCINDSTLYLASGNDGLLRLNPFEGRIHPLLTQDQLPDGASGMDIQRISLTEDAGVFVGGNYFVYQEHPSFNRFDHPVLLSENPEFQVQQVMYDPVRRGYWLACLNAEKLIFFDEEIQGYHVYRSADNKPIQALDIAIDAQDRIWVTTAHTGLLVLNDADSTFHTVQPEFPELKGFPDQLISVESDEDGNLWFAGSSQLIHMNRTSGEVQRFDLGAGHRAHGYGLTLKCGIHGDAWLGTADGLYHCRPEQHSIVRLVPEKFQHNKIANAFIKSMTVDKEGNAWVGFENDGIQVISASDHTILKAYNLRNGLPYMQVNYMATDSAGGIWAGTASGLAYFNPDARAPVWQLFNRQDGVERDYIDRPIATTGSGKLFFNIEKGFSWIDIGTNKETNCQAPKLNLISLRVDGHPYRQDVLPEHITSVGVDYTVNEIRIEIAAMDWLYPFRTKYFYHITGITPTDAWIENKEAVISLSGMKPGRYEVQLYAVSGDGIKSEEIRLPIVIHPPFWQRWWFLTLCAVALSFLAYRIYRYRIRQFQKVQEMRNTISSNLHDDIGASLSNIHILTTLAQRNIADIPGATSYITKAGDEIQGISESLSDIVWNVNPKYDDLNQLFIRMKRYAADMLEGRNIKAELHFPQSPAHLKMPMDQRRDFYLIFKEGVNNMARYSDAPSASIEVRIYGHDISLDMTDTGKGFDEHTIHFGNGIANMKQRASKWKGHLYLQSAPGKGTRLRLQMKVH